MAFSLSGSTITQSGTDASLAGLAAIAGVTTVAQATHTTYNIGNLQLLVTGTLTIDPEIETLYCGYVSATTRMVRVTGTLNIGKAITENGFTRYSEGLAIYLDDTVDAFVQPGYIEFTNTSTFNWNGGTISQQFGVSGFYGGVVRVNSANAKWIYRGRSSNNQLRQETNDLIASAFTFIGGDMAIVGTSMQLNGYNPIHCTGALAHSSATPNVEYILRDYAGGDKGNQKDVKCWAGNRTILYNSATGTDLKVGSHQPNATAFGTVRVYSEVDIVATQFGSGAIAGAKLWFQDYNNGNRRLYDQEAPNIDLRNTITYTATSDGSGVFATQLVLTGAVLADLSYGAATDATNTGMYAWDYRSKNGNTTDLFDIALASYNHALLQLNDVPLKGAGGVSQSAVFFVDQSLTQATKATVDAYTTLETPQKFYDRAKSWLVDNYTGQATTLVSRSGTLIDAGSYNVTIDATAAQAFALLGNTITIKANIYTGDMTTTGVITLANGAQFVGARTDANGTIAPPNTVSITGITAGSRLQIYNVTTATEVINTTVAGTSYSATYLEGTNYSASDLIRIRLTYTNGATAKLPYEGQVLAGSSGWALLVSQQDDTVYNGLGIDGSSVTEFVEDFPNIQVDINDPDGTTTVERLYAWFVDAQTTADGVRNWFGGIVPEDAANFRVIADILDLQIDNLSATGVAFSDGRRLYRDDGASPLVSSTTGGGSITLYAGKVYTSVISTASPVITGDIADVPAAVQSGMTAQGYTTARAPKLDGLDATVSSRLAASAYVEPLDATETQAAAAAALTAYDAVQPADLAGLATASALNAVGAAIIAEVDAIPTNPLLASDTRLNNLDATVSSRLPTSAYIAPTDAPTASETATAVRAELATELGRIDATVSSRLATSGYTEPANSDIAEIKDKTDTLVNGPTLAQIEGSSVLAKEATLASKASQTSVDALPTVADLAVVNEGVKKASLLIPHSTNLP